MRTLADNPGKSPYLKPLSHTYKDSAISENMHRFQGLGHGYLLAGGIFQSIKGGLERKFFMAMKELSRTNLLKNNITENEKNF